MILRELFRGRGSLNGRIRGTCTRILLKVRSIRHFLWLAILSKNVGIHHFESLPILPNCISPISAVLILRMADFIFSWKAMLLWSVWAHHMTPVTTWKIILTAIRWLSYRGCQTFLKVLCDYTQIIKMLSGEQTWNPRQRKHIISFKGLTYCAKRRKH